MAYCASVGCSRFAWGLACTRFYRSTGHRQFKAICGMSFCGQCDKTPSEHGCSPSQPPATGQAQAQTAATSQKDKKKTLPFDEVLGKTGKVHVYSNKNDSHFSGERMYVDGIYSGYKWQCVEFARRWLLLTKACQFREVLRASEIWEQDTLVNVETGEEVPFRRCPNGGKEPPVPGSLIIYPYEEERTPWGHVGLITHVTDDFIGIAEQNLTFTLWHPDEEFGRRVPIQRTPSGGYYLHEDDQPPCLGWMVPEAKERDFTQPLKVLPQFLAEILPGKFTRRAFPETLVDLDLSRPSHALFATTPAAKIPWSAVYDLDERRGTAGVAITNEALRLIHKGVDHIISTKEHLPSLPADILQRAFESWEQYKETELSIYGRLDFGFDGKVDKLLDVSLDSLSCALLCPLQDSWIKKVVKEDPPFSTSQYKGDLKEAWEGVLKHTGAKKIYYVETSDNNDQQINALALYETTVSAELPCQWLTLDQITIRDEGLYAPDGTKIELIFKTCPWSSVFLDMHSLKARVLLHRSVVVYEPLWKALLTDDFLKLLQKFNPTNSLLLAEGEEFNIQEPTAGRYPASGAIIIGGARSASFIKDSLDPSLSNQGPFGPAWFNIHDRT